MEKEKVMLLFLLLLISLFPSPAAGSDCVIPEDDTIIEQDTRLCTGTYDIEDKHEDGIIRFKNDDISIDCSGANIIGNNKGFFVLADNVENISIIDCNIRNFDVGILLENSSGTMIRETSVYCDKGSFGIHIVSSDSIILDAVDVYSAKNVNIEIIDSDQVLISDSSGYDAGKGHPDISHGICYRITDTKGSIVRRSSCYNAQHSGFTYRNADNSSFVGNEAYNTTEGNNMYIIDSCSDVKAVNNRLEGAAWSNLIIADSDGCNVYGNKLYNAGISGIFLDNAHKNKVYDNIIQDSEDKPIYEMESHDNLIKDNILEGRLKKDLLLGIAATLAFLLVCLGVRMKRRKGQ